MSWPAGLGPVREKNGKKKTNDLGLFFLGGGCLAGVKKQRVGGCWLEKKWEKISWPAAGKN